MNIFINGEGDIQLDHTTNNLKVATDHEEIRQIILRNLETFEGEWFLDTSLGVPWLTEILSKQVSIAKVDSLILDVIVNSAGVLSVISYDSEFDKVTRSMSVTFTAQTVAGNSFINGLALRDVGAAGRDFATSTEQDDGSASLSKHKLRKMRDCPEM